MREAGLDPLRAALAPASAARGGAPAAAEGGADFAAALRQALDGANAAQVDAERLARAFATGEAEVGLEETMVAIAKANVSFQSLVQVRSRLVAAYHDIMNMQV